MTRQGAVFLIPPSNRRECAIASTTESLAERAARPPIPAIAMRHPADLERLGDEIAILAGHLHAATYRLLEQLFEFDSRDGWSGGFRSCAHWLSWRTGIAPGAAREKLRVARALAQLPQVSEAMRRGELSYAKVRAITRVATPASEERLLEVARCSTAAHVEKIVRAWRCVDRLEEQRKDGERHAHRHLTVFVDEDGSYVVRGRLDPEVGAVLVRALEAAEQGLFREDRPQALEAGLPLPERREATIPSAVQRRADAIGVVAEAALRSGLSPVMRPPTGGADRYLVMVHVDAAALRAPDEPDVASRAPGGTGDAVLDGVRVPAETSRRIACDAGRIFMLQDSNGKVLDAGRRTRAVPPAIRRALEQRDRSCRFPGCDSRFCDAHHIVHWADGGSTRLDNLVLLCRHHHRAVHEEGYGIVRSDARATDGSYGRDCDLVFTRPDGRTLSHVPAPPMLADEPVVALCEAHRARGIDVNARTTTPRWTGEGLDVDFAVLTLRRG